VVCSLARSCVCVLGGVGDGGRGSTGHCTSNSYNYLLNSSATLISAGRCLLPKLHFLRAQLSLQSFGLG